MYKCQICETIYDLSMEHFNYIADQIKINPVVSTILSCPGCKHRRIVGGEEDYDEIDDKNIIMMFGRELKPTDTRLKEFEGEKQEDKGI